MDIMTITTVPIILTAITLSATLGPIMALIRQAKRIIAKNISTPMKVYSLQVSTSVRLSCTNIPYLLW